MNLENYKIIVSRLRNGMGGFSIHDVNDCDRHLAFDFIEYYKEAVDKQYKTHYKSCSDSKSDIEQAKFMAPISIDDDSIIHDFIKLNRDYKIDLITK